MRVGAEGLMAGPMWFNLRIVSIDYYMAAPLSGMDVCFSPSEGTAVEKVPVVRIFGSTPSGQKACLHLHRVRMPGGLHAWWFLRGLMQAHLARMHPPSCARRHSPISTCPMPTICQQTSRKVAHMAAAWGLGFRV